MKHIIKIILLTSLLFGLFSCDENENFEIKEGQSKFKIVTPTTGSSLTLDRTNPTNEALALSWEDTLNSDVTYTIEFAKAATDFADSFIAGTTGQANYSWNVTDLNTLLVNSVRIPQVMDSAVDVRIVASNGELSNSITVVFSPYVIEVAQLYINGTFNNFDPTQAMAMNQDAFNIFSINVDLVNGDTFNFLPSNVNDNEKWQLVDNTINPIEVTKFGGVDFSNYTEGNYDIVVDLNTNTITITEITFPEALFMVGAGIPDAGWGWSSPVEMTLVPVDMFEATTNFSNDTFRFFTVNSDWGSGLNYPYFINEGYTIDSLFEDALDGDNNFRFLGTPGLYTITVNGVNKTITMVEIVQSLRIAVPGNHQSWDPPTAPQLEASAAGNTDYEGYVWLDGNHKFIAPDGSGNFNWGNTDWGDASGTDGSYTQVLIETGEGNIGTPNGAGHYFIQVDTDALTYTETLYQWGVIGDATGSWIVDQDMTFDANTGLWSITLNLAVGELKFRANDDWAWNYGDDENDGVLEGDNAGNIAINTAGNYTIVMDLSNPRNYTYTLTLN